MQGRVFSIMPFSALLLPFLLLGAPVQAPDAFDSAQQRSFQQSGVPGAAVGVFKDGKLIYSKAFGVADEVSKKPFTADMAFEIGSLSKQFNAFALLMLVKEGKLALSEKLGYILPNLPESWRTATVEQTLHHMSGIPDYEEIAGYDFYNKARAPKEIIDSAATKPLDFAHGAKYSYSNTGYFLLSLVLEKKSGMASGKFLEDRIFKPLGMTQTYASTIPSNPNVPTGYHSRTGTRVAQPPIAWTSTLGAGGIVSSMRDLGKWDESLYTEKLLPANLRDKLWETTKTTTGEPVAYGFGWVMGTYRGVARQNHSGQTNGFTCVIHRFPSMHYTVIAFTNTYGGGVVFPLSGLAMSHFAPSLSYKSLPIPKDPDPERTKRHMQAMRQALFAEGDLAMLRQGVKDFATKPEFAKDRDEAKATLTGLKAFQFVRQSTRKNSAGQEIDEYLYRLDNEGGTIFWTLRFIEGLLAGLNWEVE